jgi:hypothetical protein
MTPEQWKACTERWDAWKKGGTCFICSRYIRPRSKDADTKRVDGVSRVAHKRCLKEATK